MQIISENRGTNKVLDKGGYVIVLIQKPFRTVINLAV